MARESALTSAGISTDPSPMNFLDDVGMTVDTAHELCYAIEEMVDRLLGAVPTAVGTSKDTESGSIGVMSNKMTEVRRRMNNARNRLHLLNTNFGG